MTNGIPILDADRVVHFTTTPAYEEGLGAVIAGQWLMVAPKMTIRLHDELAISVRLDHAGVDIAVVATPFYWRGPFLGMQVRAATPEAQAEAQALLERCRTGELPDPGPVPEPAPVEEVVVRAVASEKTVDAVPDEVTEEAVDSVEAVAGDADFDGAEDLTRPGAELDGTALTEEEEASQQVPEEAPAAPVAAVQVPASQVQQPAPPGPVMLSQMSGTLSVVNLVDDLLVPYPTKGTGLPLPGNVTFYRLLAVLAANGASGLLDIENEAGKGAIYLRRGALLGVDPPGSSFDDELARAIVQGNLVEAEKVQEAVTFSNESEKSLALGLYEKRALSLDMLSQVLRDTKTALLAGLITSESDCTWTFTPLQKFSRRFDPIRLDLRSALIEVGRSHLGRLFARHLEPLLDSMRDMFPRVLEESDFPIDLLGLSDKESHAIQHVLTGANRLADAYGMCLLTRHGAARLFLLLNHFGLMEWLNEPTQLQSGQSLEDSLNREYESMRSMNLFDRLEIHWASHPAQFDVALQKARKKYGPNSSLSRRSEEAADSCRKILAMREEAVQFLSDNANRRAHRVEHFGEDKMKYAADFLSKQAELNMFRNNQSNAVSLMETAIDLVRNPSYIERLRRYKTGQR